MHPNRGRVNYDSISSTAPYDLYTMIRNPHAPKPSLKNPLDSLEKIETLQTRLEKEAMERLRGGGLFNEKLVVVARAGKFVFVALTLPPYILLYSLPKWLLMNALPSFLNFAKMAFHRMQESVFQSWITQKLGNLKAGVQSAGRVITEYFTWINQSAKTLFTHLTSPFVAFSQRLVKPFQMASQYLQNLSHRLKNQWQSMLEKVPSFSIKPFAMQKISAFSEGITSLFEKLKSFSFKLKMPNVKGIMQRLTHPLKRIGTYLEKGKRVFDQWTGVAAEKMKALLDPLKEWITPHLQTAAELIKKYGNKFKNKAVKGIEAVQEKMLKIYETASQPILDLSAFAMQQLNLLIPYLNPNPFWEKFRQKGSNAWGKKRQKLQQKLQVVKSILINAGRKVNEFWKKLRLRILRFLKEALAWSWKGIKTIPAKAWKATKYCVKTGATLLKMTFKFLQDAFYGARVLYAWIRVLIRYGLQIDKKLIEEIAHWTHVDDILKKPSQGS